MNAARRGPLASGIALWILAVIATLLFLRTASQLLIPIVLAILISYVLEPAVGWLERLRVPRLAATVLLMGALLGLVVWGGSRLRDDARLAVEALPEVARRLRALVTAEGGEGPTASLREAAEALRGPAPGGSGAGPQQAEGTAGAQAADAPAIGSPEVLPLIQRGVGSIFALAGNLLVIFFLVFFLLLSGRHFRTRALEMAGPDLARRRQIATIVDDINHQIERFLLVRLVTAVVVGAATWAVLAWMDVEQAALWGILAGVFNSIPYFGPVIVSGGLLLVGLAQGGGLTQALQMSGAALLITSLEGWLLTPPLMGKAERMSALAVFLGLLLWTWIWGAWGTILAVPMLVIVKAVADHTPSLKPVGRLLAP